MCQGIDSGGEYISVGFQIKAAVEKRTGISALMRSPQDEVDEGIDSRGCHVGIFFKIITGSKKKRWVAHLKSTVLQVVSERIRGNVRIACKIVAGIKKAAIKYEHTVDFFAEQGDLS
jgi:hypothetical protein